MKDMSCQNSDYKLETKKINNQQSTVFVVNIAVH